MYIKKKAYRMMIIMIIFTLMGSLMTNIVYSYEGLPSQIRIGLFFASTAKPFVNLTSKSGLDLGYEKDGVYVNLMNLPGDGSIIIRKDGYFNGVGTGMTEVTPDNLDVLNQPNSTGPFHIQFNGTYSA